MVYLHQNMSGIMWKLICCDFLVYELVQIKQIAGKLYFILKQIQQSYK
jgi:hypothetical protein